MDWADRLSDWLEEAQTRIGALMEPTLRLGVTGLSGAGKTVFITSLVANLLRRGRMAGLRAEAEGRIEAAILTPQPDLDAPRFDYEAHLADLYAPAPRWPNSTRALAQLRVSIRYQPRGALARLAGAGVLHLDIVDYPGEWLLDLPLMAKRYEQWSAEAVTRVSARVSARPEAAAFRDWARGADPLAPFEEAAARTGAALYAAYLRAARAAGFSNLAPGRFLLPGDLEGAPALTFAPLPLTGPAPRGSLAAEMARRFEGYKAHVVRPFFRDHFARLDRQVTLVDALGAVSAEPEAVEDLRVTLAEVLEAFRPGRRPALTALFGPTLAGRRIDRLLLAVTKADHIHHTAHPALAELVADLLAHSADRAAFKGARVEAMALAALRATVEEDIVRNGETLPAIRGRLLAGGAESRLFPGEPPRSLAEALRRPDEFRTQAFAPPHLEHRPGEGPPHIRLDRALEFLIGDRLA